VKSIYLIIKLYPDIKSVNFAELTLMKFLVETGENRTPRPEEAAQNMLQA